MIFALLVDVYFNFQLSLPGVEIRENVLTGHKFTNLLKSGPLWDVTMISFCALKKEANSSWKYIKRKLTLKKYQKLFTLQNFFFVLVACTAILSSNWKSNNTTFSVFKIQPMRKRTTSSFSGLFLTVVRFNLLEW